MAGRPQIKRADLNALRKLVKAMDTVNDHSPMIAYVMRYCGCSNEEIGMVFDVSRQAGSSLANKVEKAL